MEVWGQAIAKQQQGAQGKFQQGQGCDMVARV